MCEPLPPAFLLLCPPLTGFQGGLGPTQDRYTPHLVTPEAWDHQDMGSMLRVSNAVKPVVVVGVLDHLQVSPPTQV